MNLRNHHADEKVAASADSRSRQGVAIVGIGLRFPGANSPSEFWKLLSENRSAITEITLDEVRGLSENDFAEGSEPGKIVSRRGGFLSGIENFDWKAFRMGPREAARLDPQQRLLLEVAWEAIEDAGVALEKLKGSQTGVFIGMSWNDFLRRQIEHKEELDGYSASGNMFAFASNRISYFFDLHGPSMTIDAACASSHTCIHMACQSLLNGETDWALAGAAELAIAADSSIIMSQAGLLSPSGQCRPLAADADGFVRGEGAAVIMLKRYADVTSEDNVYAVILGSAASHKGREDSLMAPSVRAQEEVISRALINAGLSASEVSYVELNGTGFIEGDKAECAAISNIFGKLRKEAGKNCRVGSVKGLIGHLGAAAGLSSVIKVVLGFKNGCMPELEVENLNPELRLTEGGLEINVSKLPVEKGFIAGINGTSLSGSNGHLVVTAVQEQGVLKPNRAKWNKERCWPKWLSDKDNQKSLDKDFDTRKQVLSCIAAVLPENVEIIENRPFKALGFDSVMSVTVRNDLNRLFGLNLSIGVLFEYPTPAELINFISGTVGKRQKSSEIGEAGVRLRQNNESEPIAIIGMACRAPGNTNSPEELWQLLADNIDPIEKRGNFYGGFIERPDLFDASFFGITPKEAELLDPQQRLILEECWHALEDAGYANEKLKGETCGVYLGAMNCDYREIIQQSGNLDSHELFGNALGSMAGRVAYFLNLKGPALVIDTACSSSAVAIHVACQALLTNEAQMALAGGVTLHLTDKNRVLMKHAGMLSADGRCKTLDQSADGFVPSDGLGIVVLKRFSDAVRDKDFIYGLIRASGINQDGKTNGLTAPSGPSQTALQMQVLTKANVPAGTISLVEIHGTGTKLGDPIELEALSNSFSGSKPSNCALGALKANIGHACAAAGVLGLIKVLLCLQQEKIPSLLNYKTPNENFSLKDSPFYIPGHLQRWEPAIGSPRRALINSFGHSGTNCVLLIEEVPAHARFQSNRLKQPYQFKRESYWVPGIQFSTETYPLIDNKSVSGTTLTFTKNLNPRDFYLKDHVVDGKIIFPGVGYLELICEIGRTIDPEALITIQDVTWGRPVVLQNDCQQLTATVRPLDHKFTFEISTTEGVHACGSFKLGAIAEKDKGGRVMPGSTSSMDKDEVYECLRKIGFDFGTSFQVTNKLWMANDAVQASLEISNQPGNFILHPSLLDGALRAAMAANFDKERRFFVNPVVPFSLGSIEVYAPLTKECIAWSNFKFDHVAGVLKQDVRIENAQGNILVKVLGFHARGFRTKTNISLGTYIPQWRDSDKLLGELDKNTLCVTSGLDFKPNGPLRVIKTDNHDLSEVLNDTNLDPVIVIYRGGKAPVSEFYRVESAIRQLATKSNKAPVRFLYFHTREESLAAAAVSGLFRSLFTIHPRLIGVTVEISGEAELPLIIQRELRIQDDRAESVRYNNGIRQVKKLVAPPEHNSRASVRFNCKGTYVITGGGGGLGQIFARYLIQRRASRICLIGRSERNFGENKISYFRADVTNRDQLDAALTEIRKKFGSIDGVIHSAGVEGNKSLLDSSRNKQDSILLPKVIGTQLLDELTANDPLEFFLLFSSVSAEVGDFGSGSYAAGNRYLDEFAHWRAEQEISGARHGKTLSINWPLWREGGMSFPPDKSHLYFETGGMDSLETETGLKAFEECLSANVTQVLVAVGEREKFERVLRVERKITNPGKPIIGTNDDLSECLQQYLRKLVSETTKIPSQKIALDIPLEKFGVDSVMIMEINQKLGLDFDGVPGTLFFEQRTIRDAANFLKSKQGAAAERLFGAKQNPQIEQEILVEPLLPKLIENRQTNGIAIIGMSGKFPKADNLNEFWSNLLSGNSCIDEIPADRWNWQSYASNVPCRWGGFIPNIRRFDAEFFAISPAEARRLDPQARLLLEETWKTLENAGYTREELNKRKTGVFVGAMWNDYRLHGTSEGVTHSELSGLANRISHYFGFQGPSLCIDTACSSSLTALHLACESLKRGECDAAVVAGVNLITHPNHFIKLSEMGLLSARGEMNPFDPEADGYIPGEGIGVLLLKRTETAERDGDQIHAIIKGTALGHNGTTSGYTVPDSKTQELAISEAAKLGGITLGSLDKIEVSALGSAVGDQVELAALKNIIEKAPELRNCAISSSKRLIGHLESASGIASLIKTVIELKNKVRLPFLGKPSFSGIYKAETSVELWRENESPRRAAITGFGAGGSVAAAVIEESPVVNHRAGNAILVFPLSAKTSEALLALAKELIAFVEESNPVLGDVAYTLQIGREPMENRVCILATDHNDFVSRLKKFASGEISGVFHGVIESNNSFFSILSGAAAQETISRLLEANDLKQLAEWWVTGARVDWRKLYSSNLPRRIALPEYRFQGKDYWFNDEFQSEASTDEADILACLKTALSHVLEIPTEELKVDAPLSTLGLSSLLAMRVVNRLEILAGIRPSISILWGETTIKQAAAKLQNLPRVAHRKVNSIISPLASQRFPLTEGQKQIWAASNQALHKTAYNIPIILRDINKAMIRSAWDQIIRNVPLLQTKVIVAAESPKLQVIDLKPYETYHNWADLSDEDISARIEDLIRVPFDLKQGPLCKIHFCENAHSCIAVIVFHHLVFDGNSLPILLDALTRDARKDFSPQGFNKFVEAQVNYLNSDQSVKDRQYWERHLTTGEWKENAAFVAGPARILREEIAPGPWKKLRSRASKLNVSINSLLLGAFKLALLNHPGITFCPVAIPIDLRPPGFEGEIGCFINPVPILLSPDQNFDTFLQSLHGEVYCAIDHGRYPVSKLLKEKSIPAGFYYHHWGAELPAKVALDSRYRQAGEYPIVAEVIDFNHKAEIYLRTSSAAFGDDQINSLLRRFLNELHNISEDSAQVAKPSVYQKILEQGRINKNKIAATYGSECLTYRELLNKASTLGHYLSDQCHVPPNAMIGVMMPRSLQLLVSLLGIWDAGAAYVPLDPGFPQKRLNYIVEDSGINLILTTSEHLGKFEGVQCICIENLFDEFSELKPTPASQSGHLAYVIYTSGSTGNPKGVKISHKALLNFIESMERQPGCSSYDHALALTTISFDIAALELFLPLATGASLEIISDIVAKDGIKLRKQIENSEATIIQGTPATWEMLLAAGLGPIPRVKALCGGEAWSSNLGDRLLERVGELWNMYGPTETTVWSSVHRVKKGEKVLIGEPISNTDFYVLDEHLRKVERGEIGELYIGGDGVADGYLNRPELTREKFVQNPFKPNSMMYRTGDLVRYV